MQMKYILDNKGAEIMRLSNDAFLYLTQEEEPLDEDNLLEAQQLYEEFPLGFEIIDYRYADNGEVIVKIVPYIEAPVIVKPKVIKAKRGQVKTISIKESNMSQEELTKDFFKTWFDKIYSRQKKLSQDDISWLENARDFFEANEIDDYANKVKNLMAS
jgi:hypothetical protein